MHAFVWIQSFAAPSHATCGPAASAWPHAAHARGGQSSKEHARVLGAALHQEDPDY